MVERVGERHPEVCQGTTKLGPCVYKRMPGTSLCPMHGGQASQGPYQRTQLKNMIISNFAAEAAQRHANGELKCLTDEIVVLRVTLEAIFNKCENPNDLLIYSDKFANLANCINRQVETLQKIEERTEELMDRQTLYKICDKITEILVQNIKDTELLGKVGNEIYELVMNNGKNKV